MAIVKVNIYDLNRAWVIHEGRRFQNLSVGTLASELGVDSKTLLKMERGSASVPDGVFEKAVRFLGLRRPETSETPSERDFLEACIDIKEFCAARNCAKGDPCPFFREITRTSLQWNVCLMAKQRPHKWIVTEQDEFPTESIDSIVSYCINTPCSDCTFKQKASPKYPWACLFDVILPRLLFFDAAGVKVVSIFDADVPEDDSPEEFLPKEV